MAKIDREDLEALRDLLARVEFELSRLKAVHDDLDLYYQGLVRRVVEEEQNQV